MSAVTALVAASKSGDEAKVKAAIGEVGKNCGSCHDNFARSRKAIGAARDNPAAAGLFAFLTAHWADHELSNCRNAATAGFALLAAVAISPAARASRRRREARRVPREAGGCVGCHTEEKKDAFRFAGGRAPSRRRLAPSTGRTSPAPRSRLGPLDEADFVRRCAGRPARWRELLPGVPYPSYTKILRMRPAGPLA